ncbi:MAG: hypothetical protein ACRYFS_15735 [Janthinobacterium lividum]
MFNAQNFAVRLSTRSDRWSLLKDFVAEWHSPLKPGDGYSASELDAAEQRLGLKLPLALRECYGFAGKFIEAFSVNPYCFTPLYELSIQEDDHNQILWLFSETQAIVSWGIRQQDLAQDAPPVYSDNSYVSAELLPSNKTFLEFILQVIVHQTVCFTEIGGNAAGKEDTADIVAAHYQPLGLLSWRYPSDLSQLYGSDDILIELDTDGKGYCWIWVAALTETALSKTVGLFSLGWDYLYKGVPID